MNKLLRANFARLWKSSVFWLCITFSAGWGFFLVIMTYFDIKKNWEYYADMDISSYNADSVIFNGGFFIMLAAAVYIGIFIGTEYHDGTIRNKISTGHRRGTIYLANLIVCTAADIIMNLAYIAVVLIFGNIFIYGTTFSAKTILTLLILTLAATVSLTSLLIMLSMLIKSKAAGSVTVLLLVMIMMITTLTVDNVLKQPEIWEEYQYIDDSGEVITVEAEVNLDYPRGTKRKILEFLNNFLPSSQFYGIARGDLSRIDIMYAYDGVMLVITTCVGIFGFRRNDLK